jgi:hypothetical protein
VSDPLTEPWVLGADGRLHPPHVVAVDADRAPKDPEEVAGAEKPDPWDEDPQRWAGTEPWQP